MSSRSHAMSYLRFTGTSLHQSGRVLVTATVGLFVGCADGRPATYPVQGKVLFRDGTAVTSGTVEFESIEQRLNARGAIRSDGTFHLSTFAAGDGAVAGRHRAVVVQLLFAQGDRAIHHDHAPGTRAARAVHPKHSRYETSGLEFQVAEGRKNVFTVKVEPAQ